MVWRVSSGKPRTLTLDDSLCRVALSMRTDAQKYAKVYQNPTFCQQECMEIFTTHFGPERYQYNGPQTNWLILQMFKASDMVWINQWSIPEPDSHWQWNQGTSCDIRDKVQDRKLCIIMAKGTLLVGFQYRNVTISAAHLCTILARIKSSSKKEDGAAHHSV